MTATVVPLRPVKVRIRRLAPGVWEVSRGATQLVCESAPVAWSIVASLDPGPRRSA